MAGFEPEQEYEYPPGNKKKRGSAPAKAPVAQKPDRPSRGRESRRSMIAADGFDFSKPYEPRSDVPDSPQPSPKADPHKPKRVVAALLGGLGRR